MQIMLHECGNNGIFTYESQTSDVQSKGARIFSNSC